MGKTINQYEAEHPAHIIDIARCLMPIAWTAECHTALRDASIRMAERMDLAIPDYLYRHYSEIGAMRARVEMEQQRRARESSPAYLLRAHGCCSISTRARCGEHSSAAAPSA
jgi:hypothetical protein